MTKALGWLAFFLALLVITAPLVLPTQAATVQAAGYTPPPQAVGPVVYLEMPDKGKTYRAYQLPTHGIELEVNYGGGDYWYGHDLGGYSLPLGVPINIFRLADDATVVVHHTGTNLDYTKTWPIYTDADFAVGYNWIPYWNFATQSNP